MPRISVSRKLSPVFAGLALILAGCGTVENTYDNLSSLWTKPVVLPCPDSRILADAAYRTSYAKGSGRDLVDIESQGEVKDIRLECVSRISRDTNEGILEVQVELAFGAKRGPADRDQKTVFPYFISVTDTRRNVLYREEFRVAVDFSGNRSSVEFRGEPVKLELPITKKVSSTDYIIYSGFMLSREQLEMNRRLKGRNRI